MRVHKQVYPEKCTKSGKVDAACYVRLEIGKQGQGFLVANNEDAIVRIPVECDSQDQTGLLPVDAIKAARRTAPTKNEERDRMHLVCGDRIGVPTADQEHGRPAPTGELPFVKDAQLTIPEIQAEQVSIEFDSSLLSAIADAIGTKRVRLSFVPGDLGPVRVDPAGESWAPGAQGAFFPDRNHEDDDDSKDESGETKGQGQLSLPES